MSTDIARKQQIENSIIGFSNKSVDQASFELLDVLGYKSDRHLSLVPNSLEQFLVEFDNADTPFNKANACFSEWKSIDLLSQITDEEINAAIGQKGLFSTKQVDNTIINSYLFFAVQLQGDEYTRTDLANITREVNKLFKMPVMLFLRYGKNLSIGIITRRINKKDAAKDVLEKVTLIKDIDIQVPHRAHTEILFDLSIQELIKNYSLTNFVDLQQAWVKTLDTNELNKKFYKEIANWYFWAVNKVQFPSGNEDLGVNNNNEISVIRLITRLIFVWFLKEKGLVSEDLFWENKVKKLIKFEDKNQSTYYKAIMQNLFFATLNQEMNTKEHPDRRKFRTKYDTPGSRDGNRLITNLYRYERFFVDSKKALEEFSKIPFLNGGLFECLDREVERDGKNVVIRIDGFSDEDKNPLTVPDEIFFSPKIEVDLNEIFDTKNKKYEVRGLLRILNSYKFTIEENTPITEEVALDPELLGKVFENLLAAYNPETSATARKQTGSYYTPREIVDYMVDEALIAYFAEQLNVINDETQLDKLRHLISYSEDTPDFSNHEQDFLINSIDQIKILDPACGSGAFPMGALHKLVHVLARLDPENSHWEKMQREKAIKETEKAFSSGDHKERLDRLKDIEETFTRNTSDFGRKLYLIENCIYGVDIQPIAVQISRLRFFISLVVDQIPDKNKENMAIRPLPNLESKFVAANTLIGIEKPQQMILRNPDIDIVETKLAEVRRKHFKAGTPQSKRKYRDNDAKLRKQLSELLKIDGYPRTETEKLSSWNPYDQNQSADFFDSEWMFNIKMGFDIVIGNPPYLESRNKQFDDSLKDTLQSSVKKRLGKKAELIPRGSDLLIYFFECGIRLIKSQGLIVYLTQNSWLDTDYGYKFQEYLKSNTKILAIIDSDYKYFDSKDGPNINTVISIFSGNKGISNSSLSFIRFHENLESVPRLVYLQDEELPKETATITKLKLNNSVLQTNKWGIIFSAEPEIFELLTPMDLFGRKIETINGVEIGQGLNLSKNHVVQSDTISKYPFLDKAKIPFATKAENNCFELANTNSFIIDKNKLVKDEIIEAKKLGISLFDSKATSKTPPRLILPRGIGNKHYCTMNHAKAYSSSGVDIYSDNASQEELLNLWLFLNSTPCWLIREISGRKNLGGGMLKAEATDLKKYPIYFEFHKNDSNFKIMKDIYEKLRIRPVYDAIEELKTEEHKKIDAIVFDFLQIDNELRDVIIQNFIITISNREKKSKT